MPSKLPSITRNTVTASTEGQGTRLQGARLLPLELIRPNPWQPRQHADAERMQELIDDVSVRGILEPLIVRPVEDDRYEVIAGERRYRAAVAAELPSVPVIVREDVTEEEAREISLVENLLREDLDIEDEARFIKALYDQKKSLRSVGDAIHKSYQYVNRRLKLLEDPGSLLAYREGLLRLDDLIAGRTSTPEDMALAELSAVTERNSDGSGDPLVTERNNASDIEEVRFFRTRSAFKPFHKLQLHVRRLEATGIPLQERPQLRETVHALIAELTTLEQALDEKEPDSEQERQKGS